MHNGLDIGDIQPVNIKYSKFSQSLDKIFRGQSLEDLQKKVKNKIFFKDREFTENESNKHEIIGEKMTVLPKIKVDYSNDNKMDMKKIVDYKKKNKMKSCNVKFKLNNDDVIISKLNRIRHLSEKENSPEPGKYNPNYKSVYKNVPSYVIKTQKFNNDHRDRVNKLEEERLENLYNKLGEKKRNMESPYVRELISPIETISRNSSHIKTIHTEYNNENSYNIYDTNASSHQPSLASSNKNSVRKNTKGIMTFEKYSSRKDIFKNSKVPILTYLEPVDLLKDNKKMFDFNKMKSRESAFEVCNPNPSVCYYNPNYNYLDKNISIIPFKKNGIEKNNKYFVIQKLWRSYDVSSDYKTVQLETYVDEKIK